MNKIETFIDQRDGEAYRYAKFGNQTWMINNLRYETKKSHIYDNSISYFNTHGCLYNWNDAIIIAPEGWHLPTD